MSKIVFVSPPITLEERYGTLSRAGHISPPLALCALAAAARKNGYQAEIIDAEAQGLTCEEAAERVVNKHPAYVGITAVTLAIIKAGRLAMEIKKRSLEIRTIIGGPHFSALPAETLRQFPHFDIGVVGEGDVTLVELLETLDSGRPLQEVNGIAFVENGEVVFTPERDLLKDMDGLPFPAWDLLPDVATHYRPAAHYIYRLPALTITTSRGCASRCTFCSRKVFKGKIRALSPARTMELLTELHYKYGIRDVAFQDDDVFLLPNRLEELCRLLIEVKMDLTWSCFAKAGHVEEGLLRLMKKAGCHEVSFGIESGSQEVLQALRKDIDLRQARRDLELAKSAGLRVTGFFMIGCPKETHQTLNETMQFIQEAPLDMIQISFFTPFPGTEIFDSVEKYGTLTRDFTKMTAFSTIPFVPYGLTKEDLVKHHRKILIRFYLRPRTVFSFVKRLRRPTDLLNYYGGVAALARTALTKPDLSRY